ncbi:hypothetical protein ACQRDX_02790 [Streptococcus sp. SGI.013]|uniref:hypothetical protein n=1 Tax=unclassified Streptococcus TaxID=2608887 RepID=UPI003D0126A1
MDRKKRKFPLVADHEIIVEQPKIMKLYETEDLITNIHGTYQDKGYQDILQERPISSAIKEEKTSVSQVVVSEDKTYAEQMRENSKRDLKRKRQDYLSNKIKTNPVLSSKAISSTKMESNPKVKSQKQSSQMPKSSQSVTELSRFSEKLRQENYILAELPSHYQQPKNQKNTTKKKNNYDFLKKSQIYNYPDRQLKTEKRVAQELNLTRFED